MNVRHTTPGAPRGPHRLAFAVVAYLMFVATMASNAPSPLYVIYQQRFHFSSLALTAVFASYAGGVLVALVVVGRLSDSVGRKRLLIPSLILLAVSAALFSVAEGLGWLFAARAVQGLATGSLTSAATAALVELEPTGDRRRASLINTVVFITGAAVGPLLFGALVQYLPWPSRLPFLVELGLVAAGLVGIRAIPETVERSERFRWRLQRPRVARPLLAAFVVSVLVLSVSWGVGSLFASMGSSIDRQLLHVSNHAAAGLVLSLFYGTGGGTQLALRHWRSRRCMGAGVMAVTAGILLVYVGLTSTSVPLFLIGTVVAGAGSGLSFMGSLALLNEVAPPAQRAEMVSAWNVVGYVALAAPPLGVGLLTQSVTLRTASGIFVAATVALCVLSLAALRHLPREPLGRLRPDELEALGLDPAVTASGAG